MSLQELGPYEWDQYYIFDLQNSILDCKVVHACWKYELDPSQGEAENWENICTVANLSSLQNFTLSSLRAGPVTQAKD